MHDKKSDLLWQTRIITKVYFFVVHLQVIFSSIENHKATPIVWIWVQIFVLGCLDQVWEQLDAARSEEHGAKRLLAAGERVLTKVVQEKKKLQDSNAKPGEELKDVRA